MAAVSIMVEFVYYNSFQEKKKEIRYALGYK
jgi:hypothetical protein